jgi:DNA-binding HxlR family transcriptional regulator
MKAPSLAVSIMHPKKKPQTECPAARTLESVGEWWSILILRDAFQGCTRFDEFQRSLGIAPNILARRLKHLTKQGLFERRLYHKKPEWYEYVLTPKGRDFFPVVVAMFAWGNRYLSPNGESLLMTDRASERRVEPIVVAADTLAPITLDNVVLVPGPKASRDMHHRLSTMRALRPTPPST